MPRNKNCANQEVRRYARYRDVTLRDIAYALGVGEATMYRWLYLELDGETTEKYQQLIDEIAMERAGKPAPKLKELAQELARRGAGKK